MTVRRVAAVAMTASTARTLVFPERVDQTESRVASVGTPVLGVSPMRNRRIFLSILGTVALGAVGCTDSSSVSTSACAVEAPRALRACMGEVSSAVEACYTGAGAPCPRGDAGIATALDDLES